MNIVDSSGWLEYFINGPNAVFFEPPLKETDSLVVPSITLYEVFKVVRRERGEHEALQAVAVMEQAVVADLDAGTAVSAAKISGDLQLPMADSIILATAKMFEAVIWTQDADFRDIEGVKFIEKKI